MKLITKREQLYQYGLLSLERPHLPQAVRVTWVMVRGNTPVLHHRNYVGLTSHNGQRQCESNLLIRNPDWEHLLVMIALWWTAGQLVDTKRVRRHRNTRERGVILLIRLSQPSSLDQSEMIRELYWHPSTNQVPYQCSEPYSTVISLSQNHWLEPSTPSTPIKTCIRSSELHP